ncbi:hypothetical protein DVA81_18560, partial [Acinetobacter baumannii]
MFRLCTEHEKPPKEVANRLISVHEWEHCGLILITFLMRPLVLTVFLWQDGDNSRPKKKKKLM